MEKKFYEKESLGHLHPLTLVMDEVVKALREIGFEVADGPEIETEFYNFDALNIPADHPARDMWDTFWLKSEFQSANQKSKIKDQNLAEEQNSVDAKTYQLTDLRTSKLLRTHTSPVQVRYMEKHQPPLRIIAPGKVFRYEATDARHEAQFYQIEGLLVDREVSVAHLKGVLENFLKKIFGESVKIRLRPSFFPFVEPGFEIDMLCFNCLGKKEKEGKSCSVCGASGWIEIMGAGLVHPSVFEAVGLDPQVWKGLAFGVGADRLAMLKYGVEDIRHFYSGRWDFIKQF